MILVHGITSSSLSWARFAEALAPRYRVIATDNKGHGDSARPQSGYRFEDQAREIAELVRTLGIDRARVVGHSWGGAIVATLATSEWTGDLVERLVLEDPLVVLSQERVALMSEVYCAQVGLTREAALEQLPTIAKPGWTEGDLAGKLDAMVKGSRDAVRGVFKEKGGRDLVPLFERLRCPALMVRAAPDLGGIVSETSLAGIRRHAPQLQVVTVPGADHNVHRTRFDAFKAVVEPFLDG